MVTAHMPVFQRDRHGVRRIWARAAEYTRVLGSVEDMHQVDRQCIKRWATSIDGQLHLLREAGFDVLEVETRQDPGKRARCNLGQSASPGALIPHDIVSRGVPVRAVSVNIHVCPRLKSGFM